MIETASAQFLGSILREARHSGKPSLFAIYRPVIIRKMNRGSHGLKSFRIQRGCAAHLTGNNKELKS
jgi:hypothetical protein